MVQTAKPSAPAEVRCYEGSPDGGPIGVRSSFSIFLRYELTGPFHSCGLMLVVVWLQIQYPGRCAGRVDRYRQEFAYTGSTKWLR